jgi:peroxiredoxin
MTRPAVTRLTEGQPFPPLALHLVDGRALNVPDDLTGSSVVVLVYRGSWCPYCAAQLASFARAHDKLTGAGVRVVAISADSQADAKATVDELHLPFPVAYGVDPDELAAAIGNYVGTDLPRPYAQSANVLLDADGRVLIAVYSSGAIGRLTPGDVLGYLAHLREDTPGKAVTP